jgi:hypothetical protein
MTTYTATVGATGSANTTNVPSVSVTTSATATATSTVSYEDAYNTASNEATTIATNLAINDANVISQTVNYVNQYSVGKTGATGPAGTFGLTGNNYSNYIYWNQTGNTGAFLVETNSTVHIGINAGQYSQQANAIAIGYQAGYTGQGQNAIAIGYQAGSTGQAPNSIVINAGNTGINGPTEGAFYVAPIRRETGSAPPPPRPGDTGATGPFALYYNPNTNEIYYFKP